MNKYKIYANGGHPFEINADNYYTSSNLKIIHFELASKIILTVSICNLIAIVTLEN